MNLRYFKNIIPAAAIILASAGMTSCVGDLDVTPIDPSTNMTVNEPNSSQSATPTWRWLVRLVLTAIAISTVLTAVQQVSSASFSTLRSFLLMRLFVHGVTLVSLSITMAHGTLHIL